MNLLGFIILLLVAALMFFVGAATAIIKLAKKADRLTETRFEVNDREYIILSVDNILEMQEKETQDDDHTVH